MINFTQGEILKSNLTATTDPTATDDITQGYEVGSTWVNVSAGAVFMCKDSTTGAAVWRTLPFGVLSPPSLGTTQNNYSPTGLPNATMLRVTSSADVTINGLAGGSEGRMLTVYNVGAFKISLTRQSGSSTAANRFAIDNDALLLPNTAALLQYDTISSRWRIAGAGSSVPTLLPAPKFFRVTTDVSTTVKPNNWATLISGSFSLASSETNLIVLFQGNVAVSSNNRRIETRVLVNGASIGGSSGNGDIANIPFHIGFLGQVLGVVGTNTFEVQWRINNSTARCRVVSFPDDENAAIAFWSSAAP